MKQTYSLQEPLLINYTGSKGLLNTLDFYTKELEILHDSCSKITKEIGDLTELNKKKQAYYNSLIKNIGGLLSIILINSSLILAAREANNNYIKIPAAIISIFSIILTPLVACTAADHSIKNHEQITINITPLLKNHLSKYAQEQLVALQDNNEIIIHYTLVNEYLSHLKEKLKNNVSIINNALSKFDNVKLQEKATKLSKISIQYKKLNAPNNSPATNLFKSQKLDIITTNTTSNTQQIELERKQSASSFNQP